METRLPSRAVMQDICEKIIRKEGLIWSEWNDKFKSYDQKYYSNTPILEVSKLICKPHLFSRKKVKYEVYLHGVEVRVSDPELIYIKARDAKFAFDVENYKSQVLGAINRINNLLENNDHNNSKN